MQRKMKTKYEKYVKTRYLTTTGTSQVNQTKGEHAKQAKPFPSDISEANWEKNYHRDHRCIQLLMSSPGLKQG